MSEAEKRKAHATEFRAELSLEALRGVKTINEIGQEPQAAWVNVECR